MMGRSVRRVRERRWCKGRKLGGREEQRGEEKGGVECKVRRGEGRKREVKGRRKKRKGATKEIRQNIRSRGWDQDEEEDVEKRIGCELQLRNGLMSMCENEEYQIKGTLTKLPHVHTCRHTLIIYLSTYKENQLPDASISKQGFQGLHSCFTTYYCPNALSLFPVLSLSLYLPPFSSSLKATARPPPLRERNGGLKWECELHAVIRNWSAC